MTKVIPASVWMRLWRKLRRPNYFNCRFYTAKRDARSIINKTSKLSADVLVIFSYKNTGIVRLHFPSH